ncbi:hypothetical protein KIN20_018038 [Parelaphostrongylus tenuis]|uniref:Uncharacterized protein n=1 Tax=Parelaphostrongylus tenuis TaxID=148309 RepID=A0AAD5N358_PARTN|nr:hypothetical protein KIN20_018038 [Parelaphostrongylus tenuis]
MRHQPEHISAISQAKSISRSKNSSSLDLKKAVNFSTQTIDVSFVLLVLEMLQQPEEGVGRRQFRTVQRMIQQLPDHFGQLPLCQLDDMQHYVVLKANELAPTST